MRTRLFLAAVAATFLMACGGGGKKDDTMGGGGGGGTVDTQKSLYDRLGGKEGITKVVDMFVANVANDPRINAFFANTEVPKFKALLVDQICDAASGGKECQYKGKTMAEAHKDMHVKQEHFDALVEDLVTAMKAAGVGEVEQQELLGVLGPMSKDIVEM
jgi:hemoglobin